MSASLGSANPSIKANTPSSLTPAPAAAPPSVSITIVNDACAAYAAAVRRAINPWISILILALYVVGPILFLYEHVTLDDDVHRALLLGAALVTAIIGAWPAELVHSAALGLHIGVETYVIDKTLAFSMETEDDVQMVLSLIAAIVIIVHLVPFLLTNRPALLTLLAGAGVVVNTYATIYATPEPYLMTLLTFATAFGLLLSTNATVGALGKKPAILAMLAESCGWA